MSLYVLTEKQWFPPVTDAMADGLLAIGGDLSVERLLLAYKSGIFPWFEGEFPLWWAPDPRFVLLPDSLKVSKSMRSFIRKQTLQFTMNQSFDSVVECCQRVERKDQDGTWITNAVRDAYIQLFQEGKAISAESWQNGELVGGLYGVLLGKVFFGESMFSRVSNASKFAFIRLVEELKTAGVQLIDCQVYTTHLESLGAKMIPREQFQLQLRQLIS